MGRAIAGWAELICKLQPASSLSWTCALVTLIGCRNVMSLLRCLKKWVASAASDVKSLGISVARNRF
jgi:hypothetical protein